MTPRTLVPADPPEATAWARHFFQVLRTTPDPVMGVYWLRKDGSRRVIVEMFKAWAQQSVHNMLKVIDLAEAGWDLPHDALKELMIEYYDRGEDVPQSLQAYNVKVLRGHKPALASTQKANQALRNIAITYAARVLHEYFGLPPTGRKGSASAVIALAMKGSQILSHRQIEKICSEWDFWGRRFEFFSTRLEQLTA